MLKISVLLWILLLIVLILLPVGIISFFFSKKIFKKLSYLLGKIDTFDALLRFKKDIVYLYTTKFSSLGSRTHKRKSIDTKYDEPVLGTTIDEIIKPKISVSKYPDTDMTADDEEQTTTTIKKRKLLEKIIYDSLGLRKDGKLDEYEKKIIE